MANRWGNSGRLFIWGSKNIADGDEEAFNPDNDFVRAMEHGFPPISGVGVGIDRLACIVFDQPTLRDVILFPMMK